MNDAIDKETQSAEQRDESEAQPGEPAASVEISEQDQANEQLLRRVPDDTTGLLRARIRQHYARMRNSN